MSGIKEEIEERDDVAAPDGKRKIKEEAPDSSFPLFETVAVRKSIDDVAPAGISKRKIKEEVIDDDDEIIVLKKKKVVKEHNFMLVNIEAQGGNTGKKALKTFIEKANLKNLKLMPVNRFLKISNRFMVRVSAVTDKNAQLIEERIDEMRWHELFCVDNLQEANPFFWKSLEHEQIITAILLATYQQNLGTPPTETLSQMLEDKKAILQAMKSGITMKKLREKGLGKNAMKMLSCIKKVMVKSIPKLMAQTVPPGDIQIKPSTKIVFNDPFHVNRTNFINIINTSAHRIAYRIIISNQTRVAIVRPYGTGVLDRKESVLVAITCDVTALEHVVDTVINDCINIAWVNTPDGVPKRFCSDWFEAPAISRDKDLPIEYNA